MAFEIANRNIDAIAPLGARASVEDQVAATLRELIVGGQLAQGTQLVQRELAERLNVSQTPVRAGLTVLAREGLVEIGSTGRAFVSRLTREDFEEIYAARRGLEGLAARLGAVAVGLDDLARMSELFDELEELARAGDVEGYLRARWEFHATCYAAAGRPRLLAEVERLFWRADRYNRLVLSTPERFAKSVRNYRRFLAACRAGDPARAERVIVESMEWAVGLVWDDLPTESE
jgi:DNA-binding GntR family transcriptional regulator